MLGTPSVMGKTEEGWIWKKVDGFFCVCTNILELIQESLLTHFPAGFPPVHTEAVVVHKLTGH